jgi:hypothetical protein
MEVTMLRSAMMAGVIALGSVGIAQPADARVFVGFGFGFPGFWGYPYPYYPGYYYPPYPYYPPYGPYPAAYPPPAAPPAPAAASPSPTVSAVDPATVREVQAELQRRGYNVGSVDGRLGARTRAAIREYEQKNGLPVDGMPSPALRDHLHAHPAG